MARFVSVFISEAHRRLIGVLVWAISFALVLGIIGAYALFKTHESMQIEARLAGSHFIRLRDNLLGTFDAMHDELTAEPCTPAFNEQMRRIAYRPDGLNEFLYAPGGHAQCSVNIESFADEVMLGQPDIPRQGDRGIAFWIDHDLGFLDLQGETGTIALSEPFAAIVPEQKVTLSAPAWMSLEVVLVAESGRWWHRSGKEGTYAAQLARAADGQSPLLDGTLTDRFCDPRGLHCIAVEADVLALVGAEKGAVILATIAAAIMAAFATGQVNGLIMRYWSFEARFRRHLDASSVVCAYQPVMELDSGEITGCEVLARWRDIDDRIVFPDRFIPVVEKHGMTLRFTELIAQRACAELSEILPAGRRIQVNFNIFPQDLDSARLTRIFAGFISQPDRFDLVLEIIESDEIPANAQREIEALRRAGVKTYIDDFGTGYSNMQNLAALSVDGVKLDRAFAMAPDNSMMARMLTHAVEMIHATGRVMVVEGVETAERLALLRQMQARVDFVQGYFISRPLDIAGFAAFLTPKPVSLAERKREAGLAIVAA
jgi:sensor c-di-GMP phosphodiesterase-like protein